MIKTGKMHPKRKIVSFALLESPVKLLKKNSRKYKVCNIHTQMLFMLPTTNNKEWDNEWFRFLAAQYACTAHMKKRLLSKYKKNTFSKRWIQKVDRFLTSQKTLNEETRKYHCYIGELISRTASQLKREGKIVDTIDNTVTKICHHIVNKLSEHIRTNPIPYDKSTIQYWVELRDYVFAVLRTLSPEPGEIRVVPKN